VLRRARCWRRFYGGFTEGFDSPDLKDAKALLDELGGEATAPRPSKKSRKNS
jgi:hypothetical protein